MSKHFKSKKKLRHDILIKYLLIIALCYVIIRICLMLVLKSPVLKLTFKHNKLESYKDYIVSSTLNNPQYMLLFYQKENETIDDAILATYIVNDKPLVYIYNTHQKEAYTNGKTVLDASYLMKQELSKYNIDTLVEDRDITEFMKVNNMSYNYSYYASKFYVKDTLSKNKLDLIIDLHRDAVSKDVSTAQIGDKKYAKVLFVIGGEHENYKKNYALAQKLNNLIVTKYPTLTRGIVVKTGSNVNGIYNQDLADNIILLEVGGHNNSFDEVNNTITVIAQIIGDYINGKG